MEAEAEKALTVLAREVLCWTLAQAMDSFSIMLNHFSVRLPEQKFLRAQSRSAKEKYGLTLLAKQVEELDLPPKSFDTITLFHVLEHVPDPRKLVALCHALLRPQGILAVAVPNDVLAWTSDIKKIGKRLGLKPFQKFSPKLGISRAGSSREIHLSHFTPLVLRRLLENSGLHVLEESLDPYYVSRGVRLFLDSAYYAAHRALHSALGINRYDTIWMVARKP